MYDILQKVLAPIGPTGGEQTVAEAIRPLIEKHVDSIDVDALGNLIAVKNGQKDGKRIMFSAHMDHIAFIVTDVEKEGYLRVASVGGIGLNVSLTRHVVFANGVEGVIVSQPVPVGETRAMKHMFIDIGAEDREAALKMVSLGDCAVYAPDLFRLGQNRVASPAMDDRCACALLVRLMQTLQNPVNTVVAVFSVQEEVGLRGARVAAYSQEPDVGIALDVTAWGDTPEVKEPAIVLGKGPAIKLMDRSSISSPTVVRDMTAAAEEAQIPYQREILAFGGTDAGAIQQTRGGVPVGTLSIPCRYVHSACEVIDLRDLENVLKLLQKYVSRKLG